MTTVYKIVRIAHIFGGYQCYMSCLYAAQWFDRDIQLLNVQYELGKVTKPQRDGGPLFAFDTLNNARTYLHESFLDTSKFTILKCRANGVKKFNISLVTSGSACDMIRFWKLKKQHKKIDMVVYKPDANGALLCDSVTPISVCP